MPPAVSFATGPWYVMQFHSKKNLTFYSIYINRVTKESNLPSVQSLYAHTGYIFFLFPFNSIIHSTDLFNIVMMPMVSASVLPVN